MRLYWKLFIWLTAALLTTVAITSWLAHQWLQENSFVGERMEIMEQMADTAAEIYAAGGATAYGHWLNAAGRRYHVRAALLDAEGRNVLPLEVYHALLPLAREAAAKHRSLHVTEPPHILVAEPVIVHGENYLWLAAAHIPPNLRQKNQRQTWWLRLGTSLAIIALVSFLLSRIITRPLGKLQQAAYRLSRGELDTRVMTDIGRRSDEIGELAERFDLMAEQLEQLIQNQRQLLRDISHELRSPLARMQLALELARQKSDARSESELARIEKEAATLERLIDELLALTKLESGGDILKRQRTGLRQLLEPVIHDAGFEAQGQQKSVVLHADEACDVLGDARVLHAAIENVIRNAVRHTPAGSAVDVSLITRGEHAVVIVRDHGPGVPETALARLFEPFYRVDDARTPQKGGFGIGLAIAARAIAAHDGTITAANMPDGGLEIRMTLPLLHTGG